MFLVSDDYGDFKKILNKKELEEMLIEELVEDTKENNEEYEIVSLNVKQLGEIAKMSYISVDYLIDNLQSYGWYVQDLGELERNVNNLREYYARKHTDLSAFDKLLELIGNGVD